MLYGREKLIELMENGYIKSEKSVEAYIDEDLISGCNCDLFLGNECYVSNTGSGMLTNSDGLFFLPLCKKVKIPPMGIMLFQTEARFLIPEQCAFRISLRMKYLKKGLIMSNQPLGQPGYSGRLYGIILNVSNKSIIIEHREKMFTLEAMEIIGNCGKAKIKEDRGMQDFAAEAISTSFRQEVVRMRRLTRKLERRVKGHTEFQMKMLSISSFIIAVLSVIIAFT